jgi:hypothetical protein
VVHDIDSERTHVPAEDCAARAEPIQGKSKRGQRQREAFHYVSSFDRLTSNEPSVDSQPAPLLLRRRWALNVRNWQILLQKSEIEVRRIFRENAKQEAIADSSTLARLTEVAGEFNERR